MFLLFLISHKLKGLFILVPSPSPYRILNLFKTSVRQFSQTRENRFSMRLVLSIPGNNQPQNTLFSINCVRQDHAENGSLQEHAWISAIKVKRGFNPLPYHNNTLTVFFPLALSPPKRYIAAKLTIVDFTYYPSIPCTVQHGNWNYFN